MPSLSATSLPRSLYRRAMGISATRLVTAPDAAAGPQAGLREVIYYAYRKGFWPLLRGAAFRPRLRRCGGRFFLGRATNILFPSHLLVGRNVTLGAYVQLLAENHGFESSRVPIKERGVTRPGLASVAGQEPGLSGAVPDPVCALGAPDCPNNLAGVSADDEAT